MTEIEEFGRKGSWMPLIVGGLGNDDGLGGRGKLEKVRSASEDESGETNLLYG